MAHWVLLCPKCKVDFIHSAVESDAIAWLGAKPEFSDGGALLECPNCKESSVFAREQLRYRRFA
jgi:hypothetical protein